MQTDIIVPMYNAASTIERCLSSLRRQQQVHSIVVVDDGSTDESVAIVKRIQSQCSKIKLLEQNHLGPSAARNLGIRLTTAPVVMFCDADDYYEREMVATLVGALSREGADIAVAGMIRTDKRGRRHIPKLRYSVSDDLYANIEGILLNSNIFGGVPNKAYLRTAIGQTNFDTRYRYCEDTIFNLSILLNNPIRMVLIDQPLYDVCYNPSSITNGAGSMEKGMNPADNLEEFADEYSLQGEIRRIIKAKVFALQAAAGKTGLFSRAIREAWKKDSPCHSYFFNSAVLRSEKIYTIAALLKTALKHSKKDNYDS